MNITRKITNAIVLSALVAGSMGIVATPQYNVSAKSCPVGYALVSGKCKAIKITGNKNLSKLFDCLTNHAKTVKEFNQCMSK
jgi:hypothetical protein